MSELSDVSLGVLEDDHVVKYDTATNKGSVVGSRWMSYQTLNLIGRAKPNQPSR